MTFSLMRLHCSPKLQAFLLPGISGRNERGHEGEVELGRPGQPAIDRLVDFIGAGEVLEISVAVQVGSVKKLDAAVRRANEARSDVHWPCFWSGNEEDHR